MADKLCSFHHSVLWDRMMKKKNIMTHLMLSENSITVASGGMIKMWYFGSNLKRHRIGDLSSGKQNRLPLSLMKRYRRNVFFRVVHKHDMKIMYEGPSDPQPTPKMVLKARWLVQEQQQQRTD